MRAAVWLLGLFVVAVAVALFAGNNHAVVSLFWPPHRVDISFNLLILLLGAAFALLYVALRAAAAVFSLPAQAQRWRAQQKERAMYGALMDALAHLLAGRYLRASRSAQNAVAQEKSLGRIEEHAAFTTSQHVARSAQLRSLAHLLVAESAQSLQNKALRDEHLQLALHSSAHKHALEVREGVQFRAARWALEDRDPSATLDWLSQLQQGAARRTLALRMKLRATRATRQTGPALETARLLAKHRAFSPLAAQSLVRGLALELLDTAHDTAQLQQAWAQLDDNERAMPELAIHAATRLTELQGPTELAREWLLPTWDAMVASDSTLSDHLSSKLMATLEAGFSDLDSGWLARIEAAQRARPADPNLQYLAGAACISRQLWGKGQQLLSQAVKGLQAPALQRKAWCALGLLAERRGDAASAQAAFRQAAQL